VGDPGGVAFALFMPCISGMAAFIAASHTLGSSMKAIYEPDWENSEDIYHYIEVGAKLRPFPRECAQPVC
jgi:hypothetical protein